MIKPVFKAKCKVWLYSGPAAWHFVTLPKVQSAAIRSGFGAVRRGWGSLPVTATIGKTSWNTSLFPDKDSGAYVLPIKAEVRSKERIAAGQVVALALRIRV